MYTCRKYIYLCGCVCAQDKVLYVSLARATPTFNPMDSSFERLPPGGRGGIYSFSDFTTLLQTVSCFTAAVYF